MTTLSSLRKPAQHLPARSVSLVRFSLLAPFVAELDARRLDPDRLMAAEGLGRGELVDTSLFVSSAVVHRLVEAAAAMADDRHLGWQVGAALDLDGWIPFRRVAQRSQTAGELLTRYIQSTRGEASSVVHSLQIGANQSVFSQRRVVSPDIVPAQTDAFTAALCLTLIRSASGAAWTPDDVMVTVSSPAALPVASLGMTVLAGDRDGPTISFPTEWLYLPLAREDAAGQRVTVPGRPEVPLDLLEAVRQVLRQRLDEQRIPAARVAQLVGLSQRTLERRLNGLKTSIAAELLHLRQQEASRRLAHTGESIAHIAQAVGYADPTSFSRAFKQWTGQSPSAYRLARDGSPAARRT